MSEINSAQSDGHSYSEPFINETVLNEDSETLICIIHNNLISSNVQDFRQWTLLHEAGLQDTNEYLTILLSQKNTNVSPQNSLQDAPFHFAVVDHRI